MGQLAKSDRVQRADRRTHDDIECGTGDDGSASEAWYLPRWLDAVLPRLTIEPEQ